MDSNLFFVVQTEYVFEKRTEKLNMHASKHVRAYKMNSTIDSLGLGMSRILPWAVHGGWLPWNFTQLVERRL